MSEQEIKQETKIPVENKQETKMPVMGMTDHSLKSGFGGQMDAIMRALNEKYKSYFVGWGFHYEEAIQRNGYTLLPTGNDYHGADILMQHLNVFKPEVLIVQSDTRMVEYLPNLIKQSPHKPIWIYYPVIDGHVWQPDGKKWKWPGNWCQVMKQADVIVAYSDFGKEILLANGFEKVERIYHSIDTTLFKPYSKEDKEAIKTSLGVSGKFVIGGVFKNMIRKNPEKYLQAFCKFREGKEDKVVLVLMTKPVPSGAGEFNLVQMAADYGLVIGKDLFFIQGGFVTALMPQVYNTFDVFWALGGMEGFNVPLIEAMACGIPVVALDATTHREILGGTGILTLPPVYSKSKGCTMTYGSYNGVEGIVCDPYDVARRTQTLYTDRLLGMNISYKEIERAITTFDYSVIKQQWVDLVDKYVITESDVPDEWKELYGSVK